MRFSGLLLALFALVAGPGLATPQAAERPGDDGGVQEAVVEVVIGNLARRTVLAREDDGELLLPAREFFDLIDLPVNVDSAGRLSAVLYPEERPLFIDPVEETALAGSVSWAIAPSQLMLSGGELYIAVPVLADLLDVRFHIDWSELRVTVTNPESLPIARRIARERARRAAASAYGRVPDQSLALQRPRWDGAVLDWALYYPGGSVFDRTSYRAGLGLNVLGGSLELRYEDWTDLGSRISGSWLGVWPEKKLLSQVGVGDVVGTGPRPTRVRGAFITNSPFVRPAFFDRDVLYGELPPGWEVELYRNGRLVDYTGAGLDGRYQLETPLVYGSNPLELRAYGPSGQMQVWEREMPVLQDRLPAGIFEYSIAAGECYARPCETTGNLDLHYGASKSMTIRGGIEAFGRDTLPGLFHPYASASGTINSRWVVHGEAMWNGFIGGDIAYAPSPDFRVGARAAVFDQKISAPLLTPNGRAREFRAFGFWRPMPQLRTFFFEANALRIENGSFDLLIARLGGSFQTGIVRWTGGVRREVTDAGGGTTASTIVDLVTSANLRSRRISPLNGLFLQTGIEFSQHGFEHLEWVASRPLIGPNRVDARISWRRGTSEPFISLGITAFLPGARTTSQLIRTPESSVQAQAFAEGSVIWNGPARRFEVAPERSLRRGGLGGLVFLDANGNGRYDGADEVLEGVRLQVGPNTLTTDEHGRFGIWDLVPFVPTDVGVDSMSLRNPLWVPAFSLATVMVGPNVMRHLAVPVVPAAEVAGRVFLRTATGARPLGGLRITIVNRETGRLYETVTFNDGEFYVLGLPRGEYEVSIPEWARQELGVSRERATVRFQVTIHDGGAEAPFVEVELVPGGN